MRKLALLMVLLLFLGMSSFAAVGNLYTYHFPKQPVSWGNPISFNNLSPGFFQVMFQNSNGVVRIATYGIAGGSMDALKDPQLVMVFTFDQEKLVSTEKY